MPYTKIKTRLAPPPAQWQNCCVPVEILLKQASFAVQKRKLVMNVLLFLAYVITLLVCVLSVSPTQTIFMSNSRMVTDVMYWDRALVPQKVYSYSNSSIEVTEGQWYGELVPGWAITSWRQFETWVQTRLLYSASCATEKSLGFDCALDPLMEQVRSTEFTQCIPFAQTPFEDALVCLGGVTSNCEQGASTNPGTCNAGQENSVDTNPGYPLTPNDEPAVCSPEGFGVSFGCSFVSGCGWTNLALGSSPQSIGFVFNTNPDANETLDEMSRVVSVTETFQNMATGYPSVVGVEYQAQAQLSGYMRMMATVQTMPKRHNNESLLVASGFLATFMLLEMIFFVKRLVQHPYSLFTPWLALDLIMIAFYVILFVVLDQGVWNPYVFTPPSNPTLQDSCEMDIITTRARNNLQLVGALVALSFIKVFRFMTLLPFSRMALSSLVFAIRKLTWALVIIAVVYFLNALACLVFFGPNAFPFRLLGGSIFSVLIVPEGFDVVYLAEQMQRALPSYSPVPSLYFTLIVFVLNRCVSSMVTALVALAYILTKQKVASSAEQSSSGSGTEGAGPGVGSVSSSRATNDALVSGAVSNPGMDSSSHNSSANVSGSGSNHSRGVCSFLLRRLTSPQFYWEGIVWTYEMVSGTRSYETIDMETAMERLARWSQHDENTFKSFITYEEIKMVLSIIDEATRVWINDRQIMDLFNLCGVVNIYLMEDARNFERVWMDTVNLEGGKGEKYKRKKAEMIAIQANRIADLSEIESKGLGSSSDNEGESAEVRQEQVLDEGDSDIASRMRNTKMFLTSLRVKRSNVEQILEGMLEETVRDQHTFEGDIGRFAMHFEVTNLLRSLGVVVTKDLFQTRAPVAPLSFKEQHSSIQVQQQLVSWNVDAIVCRDPHATASDLALELPGLYEDDVVKDGLKHARKWIKDKHRIERFIRMSNRDWVAMPTQEEKSACLYLLLRGVQLQVLPTRNEARAKIGWQARGSRGVSGAKMPLTPVQVLSLDRHAVVVCFLRDDEKPQHDPQWERLRAIRETSRFYDVRVKEDAKDMFLRSSEWDADSVFQLGEYIREVVLVETEKECYLKVIIDSGVPIVAVDEVGSFFVSVEHINYIVQPIDVLSGNEKVVGMNSGGVPKETQSLTTPTNPSTTPMMRGGITTGARPESSDYASRPFHEGLTPDLLIIEVNGKPVRSLHELGDQASFTFRSGTLKSSPPKYGMRFARVSGRRVLIPPEDSTDEQFVMV